MVNDRVIIRKFLDVNFKIEINEFKIMIYDKFNRKFINDNSLRSIIFTVFEDYQVEDYNNTPIELATEWYNDKKNEITHDIISYLNNLDIVYDSINWTIKKDGKDVTEEKILGDFNGRYNSTFLKNFISSFLRKKTLSIELTQNQKKIIRRFGKSFNI